MRACCIISIGFLPACAARSEVHPFDGFPTNCSETVLEEIGPDETSGVLGFSGADVALTMTATATEDADIVDHAETLPVDLTTTADVADSTVEVVETAGDDTCLQGQYLRASVYLLTTGTMNGWSVDAEEVVVVYASAASFDAVLLGEDENGVSGDMVTLAPELGQFFQDLFQTESLSGDPGTWTWSLGPRVAPQMSWPDAVSNSKLGVSTTVSGVDYAQTLARYVAFAGVANEP
jgi:hypothetical protein